MTVKYFLQENLLTEKPNDFSARVISNESVTESQLMNLVTGQGSGITQEQAMAVWEGLKRAVITQVEQGRNINTPIFNLNISISGVFNGATDSFNQEEHKVKLNLTVGTELKKAINNIKVEKVVASKPTPILMEFNDVSTSTYNDKLTPGNIGEIMGSKLKFNAEDPLQGIFFINKQDNTEAKVSQISRNKSTNLMFLIPAELTPGKYTLVVRATVNNGKEVREGKLKNHLQVD